MQKMLPAAKNINCVREVERRVDEKKGTLNGSLILQSQSLCHVKSKGDYKRIS